MNDKKTPPQPLPEPVDTPAEPDTYRRDGVIVPDIPSEPEPRHDPSPPPGGPEKEKEGGEQK